MHHTSGTPTQVQSICILRLSAIGDVTHVLPVVHTLQRHYPHAHITWIIGKLEYQLVGDLPGIEFIVFDKSKGWRSYHELRKLMKDRHYDLLLHMQIALRASLLSALIPARIRLGYDKARAKNGQWLFTNAQIAAVEHQHVLDSFLEFARWLGLDTNQPRWELPIPEQAVRFAGEYCGANERVLLINPCTSVRLNNWRNWSVQNYAAVADYAISRHGMKVILTGGPSEQEIQYAAEISQHMAHQPINLCGQTTLKQLLALIRAATVMIAPDTGPMHMATVVDTPVIGLFATSNPLRTGPYRSQQWVVNAYPQAMERFTGKRIDQVAWGKRVRDPAAMELITVDAVIENLDRVLTSPS